jgi:hypothetical protein
MIMKRSPHRLADELREGGAEALEVVKTNVAEPRREADGALDIFEPGTAVGRAGGVSHGGVPGESTTMIAFGRCRSEKVVGRVVKRAGRSSFGYQAKQRGEKP